MSLSTPRKRKAPDIVHALSDEEVDEDGERSITGEAIDWREEEVVIGPTPQKHGRVLGLFDNLSPEDAKFNKEHVVSAKREVKEMLPQDRPQHKRPARSAKSPQKTPSFLRRQVISLDDEGDTNGPRLLFPAMPRRGLSTLINELREMEDKEEDEGMNVLREMEADFPPIDVGAEEGGVLDKASGDTQAPVEKVKWQKKGLKRSHRRVIMRPSIKRKDGVVAAAAPDDAEDDSDEYIRSEDELADDVAALGNTKDDASRPKTIESARQAEPGTESTTTAQKKKNATAKKPGGVSQNYKSLKLRNSGAKGGSRFGRGRFGGRR